MARARRFTNEQVDELRRLRAEGATYSSLAALFGAPLSSIASAIRYGYVGEQVPPLLPPSPGRPRRFSPDVLALVADRRAAGFSISAIARELEAPLSTVQRAAIDHPREPLKTCPACHRPF